MFTWLVEAVLVMVSVVTHPVTVVDTVLVSWAVWVPTWTCAVSVIVGQLLDGAVAVMVTFTESPPASTPRLQVTVWLATEQAVDAPPFLEKFATMFVSAESNVSVTVTPAAVGALPVLDTSTW